MRYDHFHMLPEKAFQPRSGRFGMTLEGGGGGNQPTQQVTNELPAYAKPYVERMVGRGEALTTAPYQTYGGERIAPTAEGQLAARQGVAGLTQPGQSSTGLKLTRLG